MDVGLALPMVLIGLSSGIGFGHNRVLAAAKLPTSKILPRWASVLLLLPMVAVVIWVVVATPTGYIMSTILDLGLMGLAYLVSYAVGTALGFLVTRHLAKKRRSA